MAVSQTIPTVRVGIAQQSVSDSAIEPFLQADFDPADYLNNALPTLSATSTSRTTSSSQQNRSVPISELSSQLQTLLSQLNAQTSRLSNTLTQLTDEIIRGGGRLAYEVELLRGETNGLKDSLDSKLKEDIDVFSASPVKTAPPEQNGVVAQDGETEANDAFDEPDTLGRLKTLSDVRSRLDSVIKVFGEAMAWPIAPSELSVTSSLISVSAPDGGDDAKSREEKGKAHAEKLRSEISDLVGTGKEIAGLEAAISRIEELRILAEVWKGTSEEKARLKQIESLQRSVDDKQKSLEKSSNSRRPTPAPSRGMDMRYGNMDSSRAASDGGYGFLQNLRTVI